MTLYEISREYSDFVIAVENGEIPEEAINDTFEMLTGELDEKIDNTACVIKNLNAEAAAIKGEIDALAARRSTQPRRSSRSNRRRTCRNRADS